MIPTPEFKVGELVKFNFGPDSPEIILGLIKKRSAFSDLVGYKYWVEWFDNLPPYGWDPEENLKKVKND